MLPKSTTVTVSGISTQANSLSQTPTGALRIADNVVLRRVGIIEPAPKLTSQAFSSITDTNKIVLKSSADAGDNYVSSIILGPGDATTGGRGLQIQDPATLDSYYYTAVREAEPETPTRALQFGAGRTQTTYSRDRRIITTDYGAITWTRNSANDGYELHLAGLQQPGGLIAARVTTPPLSTQVVAPANTHCYYCAVFFRKYPTYELVSAPTAVYLYENGGADTYAIQLLVYKNNETTPLNDGDICIIYRTPFVDTSVDPGSEFQECVRVTYDADAVDPGYLLVRDMCLNANLGPLLYTNPSRQGSGQANWSPPDCRSVATYNDTTFYASNFEYPSVSFGINDFGSINDGATVGVYVAPASVATSPGDDVIHYVGVDLSDLITVGMVVTAAAATNTGLGIVSSVVVDGFGDTYVHLSSGHGLPGHVSTAATLFYYSDYILFDAVTSSGGTVSYLYWYVDSNPWNQPARFVAPSSQPRALVISSVDVPEAPAANFTITCNQAGRFISFTITVNKGYAYTQLDSVDSVTEIGTKACAQNQSFSRVYFSKTSLPEAVPPLNYVDVGHGSVLRLISDNNSLYVLCTDGLYRVTGTTAPWTVVQLSKTHRLVHPDAACSVNGRVFAWFTEGVCLVDENGATNISTQSIGNELSPLATQVLTSTPTWGVFMVGDDLRHEFYLNVSAFDYDEDTFNYETTYAFNLDTTSWVTRTAIAPQAGAYVPALNTMYWCRNSTPTTAPRLYSEDPSLGWENAAVVFNDFSAGAPGVLKQWVDVNLLVDTDVDFVGGTDCKLQFLFDGDEPAAQPSNYRFVTAKSIQRAHCWVPRRVALNDTLGVGFIALGEDADGDACSVYFKLLGITLRYRVASGTFQT